MRELARAAVLLLLAPACVGAIGSPGEPGSSVPPATAAPGSEVVAPGGPPGSGVVPPGQPPGTPPPPAVFMPGTPPRCDGPVDAGLGLLLRLTRVEYNNTVRDLLGDTARPGRAFSDDAVMAGFRVNAVAPPSESEIEQYRGAAETLAERAVANLATLLPCTGVESGTKVCADKFIRTFGRRAFRRPLDAQEVQAYTVLFDKGMASDGFPFGINLVVRGMLQSPAFLYRIEVGQPVPAQRGLARLNAWELASRLSYALWRSMPDDELLDAAAGGRLESVADIGAQVRRMLTSPAGVAKARDSVADFVDGWMDLGALDHVEKDAIKYKTFKSLVGDMQRESYAFVQEVMLGADSHIGTLLTAPFSFVTGKLAPLYGVTVPAANTAPTRVDMPAQRSGVLTHASLMAVLSHDLATSPVKRGVWVREALLCQIPPPPPPDVNDTFPSVNPNLPAREKLAMHRASPSCAACHDFMDPIGFAFENFDPVGAYRTLDGGKAVDATGQLRQTDVDGPFNGVRPVADSLARSAQVQDCMTRQWLRFTLGRVENIADKCTLAAVDSRLAATGGDLRDALTTLVSHESFRNRRTEEVVR